MTPAGQSWVMTASPAFRGFVQVFRGIFAGKLRIYQVSGPKRVCWPNPLPPLCEASFPPLSRPGKATTRKGLLHRFWECLCVKIVLFDL